MGHGAVFDLIHNSPDVESVTVAGFDLKKAVNRGESMHNSRNKMMPSPVRSNAFRTWNDNPSAERIHWLGIKNGIAQAERRRKPRCSRTKDRMAGRCFANTAPITKKIA